MRVTSTGLASVCRTARAQRAANWQWEFLQELLCVFYVAHLLQTKYFWYLLQREWYVRQKIKRDNQFQSFITGTIAQVQSVLLWEVTGMFVSWMKSVCSVLCVLPAFKWNYYDGNKVLSLTLFEIFIPLSSFVGLMAYSKLHYKFH